MDAFDAYLNELITHQRTVLLKIAKRICSSVVEEDLLQPNDFPELENHPEFRYEEGYLHALLAVQAGFKIEKKKGSL